MSVHQMHFSPVGLRSSQGTPRTGFKTLIPAKSFSLSVTTTQSFATATAAMITSSALRGFPAALPSAISCAQTSPALSSNDSIRPAKSACGPSDPENQRSRMSRFFPRGFSRMPRRILPGRVSSPVGHPGLVVGSAQPRWLTFGPLLFPRLPLDPGTRPG